jgi:hypothetical protein
MWLIMSRQVRVRAGPQCSESIDLDLIRAESDPSGRRISIARRIRLALFGEATSRIRYRLWPAGSPT